VCVFRVVDRTDPGSRQIVAKPSQPSARGAANKSAHCVGHEIEHFPAPPNKGLNDFDGAAVADCGEYDPGRQARAHHLKFAQPTALGRKVSDEFTVPLCSTHHRELHQQGDERVWWAAHKIDALSVAEELWKTSIPNLVRPARSMEISEMTERPIAPDLTKPS
jgi:hypothetical protein